MEVVYGELFLCGLSGLNDFLGLVWFYGFYGISGILCGEFWDWDFCGILYGIYGGIYGIFVWDLWVLWVLVNVFVFVDFV